MAEPEKVEQPQSQPESEPLPPLFPPGESQTETRGAQPDIELRRR
jgi:hypothetical protein